MKQMSRDCFIDITKVTKTLKLTEFLRCPGLSEDQPASCGDGFTEVVGLADPLKLTWEGVSEAIERSRPIRVTVWMSCC